MSLKLFAILLGGLCCLANVATQVHIPIQNSTHFTLNLQWGNQDELTNITQMFKKLTSENEDLFKRLTKIEEANLPKRIENLTSETENLRKRLDKVEESNMNVTIENGNLLKRLENMQNAKIQIALPETCTEALAYGQPSGVYTLNISESGLQPFSVYCLRKSTAEEPWTVVQRRQNGSVDFFRNWVEYVDGFGVASGEYWMGLQKLHIMTSAQPMELWVKLEDYEGETRSAFYEEFVIGDASEDYELKTLGKYSGDAGDSFSHHINAKFSTKDRDNDLYANKNCALTYTGAWWYQKCHESNLNGKYGDNSFSKGVNWNHFKGWNYSLKYAHMAIRPRRSV